MTILVIWVYIGMEIKNINKSDINFEYFVTFSLSNGILNCKCDSVTNIPGTNNGEMLHYRLMYN